MKNAIKKLIATFAAVALVAVPAQAQTAGYSTTSMDHASMSPDNIVQVAS